MTTFPSLNWGNPLLIVEIGGREPSDICRFICAILPEVMLVVPNPHTIRGFGSSATVTLYIQGVQVPYLAHRARFPCWVQCLGAVVIGDVGDRMIASS